MKKLILIGGGDHSKACIDVIEQEAKYQILGILDNKEKISKEVLGYTVIGTDDDIEQYRDEGFFFLVTVGQIRSPATRKELFAKLEACNAKLATIVSPYSYVSRHASIGKGTIVMHDALINAGASVGENCIINSKALIEHDVIIEDHCHISTAAVVNGGVLVRAGTFFGSNAVSKEYTETSNADFIKAGSIYKGKS